MAELPLHEITVHMIGNAHIDPIWLWRMEEGYEVVEAPLPVLVTVVKEINTPRYPSNWELSTARAASVARYLVRKGIDPKRISIAGYGELKPIASNDTPEGRARNRRVEILILKRKPSFSGIIYPGIDLNQVK